MMPCRILILGGYGNFGSYIARSLATDPEIQLIIAGRSRERAQRFASSLNARNRVEAAALDIDAALDEAFAALRPDVVIHTVGPFQRQGYGVAEACIAAGAHYLDLADARAFVAGIGAIDASAKRAGMLVVSGASSVPCLSAAVIDHYRGCFAALHTIDYGISAAQQTNRGLGTAAAILSYVGKPFRTLRQGKSATVYGWQDLRAERYPELGRRLFGNCDIPDLQLFPQRYPEIRTIRFGAGHEIATLHILTWALSWLVRARIVPSLDRFSAGLLKASFLFDRLGSSRSGFHMYLTGMNAEGKQRTIRFFLIARSGHGPYIPCVPAILLARRLARGELKLRGAIPCLDLIDLDTYLFALKALDISIQVEGADA